MSVGDASHDAGGALSPSLRLWLDVNWIPEICHRCKLSSTNPHYLHINCLEFVVVILQLAAATTSLENLADLPLEILQQFPNGIPNVPTILMWTDNTPSKKWANKVSTAST
jgi:hypothetical protein